MEIKVSVGKHIEIIGKIKQKNIKIEKLKKEIKKLEKERLKIS